MDRIPERLRTAAEGVAKTTQMMADAKSARNGDGACYRGLRKEDTVEWQAADQLERLRAALETIVEHYEWRRHAERGELGEMGQNAIAALDA